MEQRLPYYMAYPMPLQFDDERIDKRDMEYMKSMYPGIAKMVLPFVEEECDRMEYDGSMIYDEYPDKLQMHLMCRRVYDKVKAQKGFGEMVDEELVEVQENRGRNRKDELLNSLVQVLVFQELYKRRHDFRRQRRRFY